MSQTNLESSSLTDPPVSAQALNIQPAHPEPRGFYRFTHIVFSLFSNLYLRREVIGLENIPAEGPFLVLPTHCSYIDPPLLGAALPREVYALSRSEILKVPIVGWLCRRYYHALPIERGQRDREALRLCRHVLQLGWPLIYFPEGQRSPTGTLQPLQRGWVVILESMPDVPWVPIQMQSTYHIMRRGQSFPRPRQMRIVIGKPRKLPPRLAGEASRTWHERCNEILKQALRELGAE